MTTTMAMTTMDDADDGVHGIAVLVMMSATTMVMVMMVKRAIFFRHSNVDPESLLAHSWLCSIAGLI